MTVRVYAPACGKCRDAEEVVRSVIEELRRTDVELITVSDLATMMADGVFVAPAIMIDGRVRCTGRVPHDHEVRQWLEGRSQK